MENTEINQNILPESEEKKSDNSETVATDETVLSHEQQIPNEDLAKLINGWFMNIRNVLKTVKEKDANLYKMNSELQAYRNDYSRQLFKSIAQNIINFREDCAKSLRDAEQYELNEKSVIKYLKYIPDEYEMLLQNIGVETDGECVTLNGFDINAKSSGIKPFTTPVTTETDAYEEDISDKKTFSQNDVIYLLDKKTEEIKSILKNNSMLDVVISEFIKQSELIERNEQQVVLYPVIRQLVQYFNKIKDDIDVIISESDNQLSTLTEAYKNILGTVLNQTETILNLCQVTVEHALAAGDTYDPKRHRIMKFIPISPDEAEKNGKIVKVYSDLYKTDDKVIYSAKVDVCKVK